MKAMNVHFIYWYFNVLICGKILFISLLCILYKVRGRRRKGNCKGYNNENDTNNNIHCY